MPDAVQDVEHFAPAASRQPISISGRPEWLAAREKVILIVLLGAAFMGSVDFSVLGGAAVNQQTRACLEPIALTSPRLWSYPDFPRRGLSPPGNSRMGATTVEVPTNHVAMVSHPDDGVQLIETAAEAVQAAN